MKILNLTGETILEGTGTIKEIIERAVLMQKGAGDFKGLDLRNAYLPGQDLSYLRGTEIDFRGSNLTGTIFYRADLRKSDFRGSITDKTDFTEADTSLCNFDSNDISTSKTKGTNFKEAVLTNIKKAINQEIII